MDYEKKIREYLNSNEVDQLYKSMLINLFPELKESEDEKIRKLLINGMKSLGYRVETFASIPIKDIIAWLENQKELKYLDTSDCEPWSDEQTRKNIINFLKSLGATEIPKASYNSYMKWLEKQGEHYNFRQNVQIGDKVTRNKDGVLVNLSQLERVVKKDEKQCEQKPIEDELFDNRVQYASIEEGIKAHAETYSFNIDSLLYNQLNKDQQELWRKEIEQAVISGGEAGVELANDRRYQKKPVEEVNGEDYGIYSLWHAVRILEDTLGKVDGYQSDDGILEHKAAITAVKNLKEQKPVEWSEDDEAARKDIIDKLERIKMAHVGSECEICQMEIGWLKSLHPQKQWKPSEEQLDALYDVLNPSDGVDKKALESLYEQLKAIGCE